jgi:hypothetical protein
MTPSLVVIPNTLPASLCGSLSFPDGLIHTIPILPMILSKVQKPLITRREASLAVQVGEG